MKNKEIRAYSTELRVEKNDGKRSLNGYAAVYNKRSVDLGGFTEQLKTGAFDNALKGNPDIPAIYAHQPNSLLGRTSSGTLSLSSDKTGLHYQLSVPNTTTGNDLMELVERGDISGCSFAMTVNDDDWDEDGDGNVLRTVNDVDLYEITFTPYPAYPDTSIALREYRDKKAKLADPSKTVDGEVLHASDFIIVGDEKDPATWHLPYQFSTEEKTQSHLRDALARFSELKGLDAEVLKAAHEKLVSLCKKHGIEVSDDDERDTLRLRLRLAQARVS